MNKLLLALCLACPLWGLWGANDALFVDQHAEVAQALARKFNWRIQPSGDAALNLARVLYDSGNREEARRAAQRALEKGVADPKDARTNLHPD